MKDIPLGFGLYGPESIVWHVHSYPSGWVGGIRALLLQALEPRAMAGVAKFSNFTDDVWSRFNSTSDFVMTLTYCELDAINRAVGRVRQIHQEVNGFDPISGMYFSASDPYLLAYVHNCLVDSLLSSYVAIGPGLDLIDQNRYISEMKVMAELIGADMDEIPLTVGDLDIWLASRPGLCVSDDSRRAADAIRDMNVPPIARPFWAVGWNAAVALLPDFVSDLYQFSQTNDEKVAYVALAKVSAKAMKVILPGHPYYREAKYQFYRSYVEDARNRSMCPISTWYMICYCSLRQTRG